MKRLGTPHQYGENWHEGTKFAVLLDRSEKVEFTAQVDYRAGTPDDGKHYPYIRMAGGALFLEEDAKAELIEWAEAALRERWGEGLDVVIGSRGPPPDWRRLTDPADEEESKASREPDPEAMRQAREEVEALGGKVSL